MHRVHAIIPGALVTLLGNQPLSSGKVEFAWRLAVGAVLARASTIELKEGGVLEVLVTDARWAPELRRLSPMIKARLDAMLGVKTVRRLDVRLG
jgi:hypothetical protein